MNSRYFAIFCKPFVIFCVRVVVSGQDGRKAKGTAAMVLVDLLCDKP